MFNILKKNINLKAKSNICDFRINALKLSMKLNLINNNNDFHLDDILECFLNIVVSFVEIKDFSYLVDLLISKDFDKLDEFNNVLSQNDNDFLLKEFLIQEKYENIFNLFYCANDLNSFQKVIDYWNDKADFLNLKNINIKINNNLTINYDNLNNVMINKIRKGFKV